MKCRKGCLGYKQVLCYKGRTVVAGGQQFNFYLRETCMLHFLHFIQYYWKLTLGINKSVRFGFSLFLTFAISTLFSPIHSHISLWLQKSIYENWYTFLYAMNLKILRSVNTEWILTIHRLVKVLLEYELKKILPILSFCVLTLWQIVASILLVNIYCTYIFCSNGPIHIPSFELNSYSW